MNESMDEGTTGLRVFGERFYRCSLRRADALFELCDAILTAGSIPPPSTSVLCPPTGADGATLRNRAGVLYHEFAVGVHTFLPWVGCGHRDHSLTGADG